MLGCVSQGYRFEAMKVIPLLIGHWFIGDYENDYIPKSECFKLGPFGNPATRKHGNSTNR